MRSIHKTPSRMSRLMSLLLLALLAFSLVPLPAAQAAAFIVNTTTDISDSTPDGLCDDGSGNCSLREAISEANGNPGADTITFASSLDGVPITLAIAASPNENNNANGDLDIRDNLTLAGNGASNTIIDGAMIDRVFDIPVNGLTVGFNDLTIQNGAVATSNRDGGGLENDGSTVTINNSVIDNNTSPDDGGGISNLDGTMTINNSVISNNSTIDDGGGISNFNGMMTINDSVLSVNRTVGPASPGNTHGGGIRNASNSGGSILIVNNTVFDGNQTVFDGSGGGIWNVDNSTLTITNSSFANNSVIDDGGGIYISSGSAMITDSTFYNNFANTDGGGLSNEGGMVTIINSTISGNQTNNNGAGLANHMSASTMNLNHVTIVNNVANVDGGSGDGGGVSHTGDATTTISNTIIINNDDTNSTLTDDCNEGGTTVLTSGGYNMLKSGTGCGNLNQLSDFTTATPGLDVLQNNGGDTETHGLLGISPAIDYIPSGTNGCGSTFTTDQRGAARPFTTTCDIGAYEVREVQTVGTCSGAALSGLQTFTFSASGNTVTINVNAGNSLTCLSVEEMGPGANHPAATGPGVSDFALMTNNWWHITGDVTTGLDVDITLPFSGANVDTRACKWPGNLGGYGWDCDDGTNTSFVAGTSVTRSSVTSFSDWAVGDNVGPTAITLQTVVLAAPLIPVVLALLLLLLALISWRFVRRR